jgi:hypothetical protein
LLRSVWMTFGRDGDVSSMAVSRINTWMVGFMGIKSRLYKIWIRCASDDPVEGPLPRKKIRARINGTSS